jgi:hypothetical protein
VTESHLYNEPERAEGTLIEQDAAFARSSPAQYCPHCGHNSLIKTDLVERAQSRLRPSPLGSSAMPDESLDGQLERWRQELGNLQAAIVRDPPLDAYTRSIAEAKISKLQKRLEALEGTRTPV